MRLSPTRLARAALALLLAPPPILAVPLSPRQAALATFAGPYVGAPSGDFYHSEGQLECELLRISFGGGDGPPYLLSFVTPPASSNDSLEEVQVLERVGFLGMPGFVYFDLDAADNLTALTAHGPDGPQVALQIIDRGGQVGYSVPRHIRSARLNEFCHLPGAFWPPSRWDGTHFSILLLIIFLGGPFSLGFLLSFQREWRKARRSARQTAATAAAPAGTAGEDALPLQERTAAAPLHVLGGEGDDERTSLEEEEDEDRPLLHLRRARARGADDDQNSGEPESAPPGYEDAIKEDPLLSSPLLSRVEEDAEDEHARTGQRDPLA